jgi:hypothetical protein
MLRASIVVATTHELIEVNAQSRAEGRNLIVVRQRLLFFVDLLLFRKCLDFFRYLLMPFLALSMRVLLTLGFESGLVFTIEFF